MGRGTRTVLVLLTVAALMPAMANAPAAAAPSSGCVKVTDATFEEGPNQGEIFFDKTVTIDYRYGNVKLVGSCEGAPMQVDDRLILTNETNSKFLDHNYSDYEDPESGDTVQCVGFLTPQVHDITSLLDPGINNLRFEGQDFCGQGDSGMGNVFILFDLCGATITTNLTLKSDMNCTGDGLIVGAPDITIDLNDYEMTGDQGAEDVGVDNNAGHEGVKVRNGEIRRFGTGINLFEANENTIGGLLIYENVGNGILMSASSGNTIQNVTARGNGTNGFRLLSGDTNTFNANLVEDHPQDGIVIGIDGQPAPGNILTRNRVQANGGNGITIGGSSADDSIVKENKVDGNGGGGIDATNAPSSIFRENKTRDNFLFGIQVRDVTCPTPCAEPVKLVENVSLRSKSTDGLRLSNVQGAIVRGNRANSNDGRGIDISGGRDNTIKSNVANDNGREAGIRLFLSSGNELVGNTTNSNGTADESGDVDEPADGIEVEGEGDQGHSNTLRVNLAADNTRDGFHLTDADDNHLIANTARENREDGFHVDDLSVANDLRNNRSVRNVGIGYNIEHASTTGGNNAASGNGFVNCFAPPGNPVC